MAYCKHEYKAKDFKIVFEKDKCGYTKMYIPCKCLKCGKVKEQMLYK